MISRTVRRADLLRYAAASGDDNPIHQDPAAARAAGLPDVVAHGMFVLGLAMRAVAEWTGDTVTDYRARFVRPVVVPAEGTVIDISGRRDDDEISVTVRCHDEVVTTVTVLVRP